MKKEVKGKEKGKKEMKQTLLRIVLLVVTVLIINSNPIQTNASESNPKSSQEREEEGELKLITGETITAYGASDVNTTAGILFNKIGYITSMCEMLYTPSIKSRVGNRLKLNAKIRYADYNKRFKILKSGKQVFFIKSKWISKNRIKTKSFNVSGDRCKTYESYTAIGTKGRSTQSKLQAKAETRKDGVRVVNDRVCIAVGSHYKANIGQYVDVHLKNGTIIECIVGDWKANCHTINNHTLGLNHDAIEVIVDVKTLKKTSKVSGDMSDLCKAWDSKVKKIVTYDKNVFD
jgi:hypothetical protein